MVDELAQLHQAPNPRPSLPRGLAVSRVATHSISTRNLKGAPGSRIPEAILVQAARLLDDVGDLLDGATVMGGKRSGPLFEPSSLCQSRSRPPNLPRRATADRLGRSTGLDGVPGGPERETNPAD